MGGAEGVAVERVCVGCAHTDANFFMCTCVYSVISECHQGRRLLVFLRYGRTCITFIDAQAVLETHL